MLMAGGVLGAEHPFPAGRQAPCHQVGTPGAGGEGERGRRGRKEKMETKECDKGDLWRNTSASMSLPE